MKQEILEQTYRTYLSAYSVTNSEDRESLLKKCVADEIMSVLPNEQSQGIAQLSQHIQRFQQERRGVRFRSRVLSVHHEQFLAELVLNDDEKVLTKAQVYGKVNERGLLTYLIAFFPSKDDGRSTE